MRVPFQIAVKAALLSVALMISVQSHELLADDSVDTPCPRSWTTSLLIPLTFDDLRDDTAVVDIFAEARNAVAEFERITGLKANYRAGFPMDHGAALPELNFMFDSPDEWKVEYKTYSVRNPANYSFEVNEVVFVPVQNESGQIQCRSTVVRKPITVPSFEDGNYRSLEYCMEQRPQIIQEATDEGLKPFTAVCKKGESGFGYGILLYHVKVAE